VLKESKWYLTPSLDNLVGHVFTEVFGRDAHSDLWQIGVLLDRNFFDFVLVKKKIIKTRKNELDCHCDIKLN